MVVSRFNDYMGDHLDSLLSLPGKYDEMSDGLKRLLQEDFDHFGIGLSQIYINSITPPPEVQQAIDDQSRLAVLGDLDRLVKMKAAMALEKASVAHSEAGAGLGMGMAMMMPGIFSEAFRKGSGPDPGQAPCPACQKLAPVDSRFCPYCGKHLVVFERCSKCNADIPPSAKFCPGCGSPASEKKQPVKCPHCGTEIFRSLSVKMRDKYISDNWKIEHCCPHAAHPSVLEVTDRIIQCPFCRVRLFICPGDHFRDLFAPGAPFVPAAFCSILEVERDVIPWTRLKYRGGNPHSSLLAMRSVPLPLSLGVRPRSASSATQPLK